MEWRSAMYMDEETDACVQYTIEQTNTDEQVQVPKFLRGTRVSLIADEQGATRSVESGGFVFVPDGTVTTYPFDKSDTLTPASRLALLIHLWQKDQEDASV